jgi:hypothetical protein
LIFFPFHFQTDLVPSQPLAVLHQRSSPGDEAFEGVHTGGNGSPYRDGRPNETGVYRDVGVFDKQSDFVCHVIQLIFLYIQHNDKEFVAFPSANKVKKMYVVAYGSGD